MPDRPDDPRESICERHDSAIVAISSVQREDPALKSIQRLAVEPGDLLRSVEHGACPVDEQRTKVGVAAL